jgi:hypothetical protein
MVFADYWEDFDSLNRCPIDSMHLLDQGVGKILIGLTMDVTPTAEIKRARSLIPGKLKRAVLH